MPSTTKTVFCRLPIISIYGFLLRMVMVVNGRIWHMALPRGPFGGGLAEVANLARFRAEVMLAKERIATLQSRIRAGGSLYIGSHQFWINGQIPWLLLEMLLGLLQRAHWNSCTALFQPSPTRPQAFVFDLAPCPLTLSLSFENPHLALSGSLSLSVPVVVPRPLPDFFPDRFP